MPLESTKPCVSVEETRIRVYISGCSSSAAYQIAASLEDKLGQRGSAIIPQKGRWHGEIEDGFVIECCTPKLYINLSSLGEKLKKTLQLFDLTAYVTAEQVTSMEVY